MKFKVFEPNDPSEKEEETIFLKLKKEDGGIILVLCDKYGDEIRRGNILAITSDGLLRMIPSVSDKSGLQLSKDGLIKLKKGSYPLEFDISQNPTPTPAEPKAQEELEKKKVYPGFSILDFLRFATGEATCPCGKCK